MITGKYKWNDKPFREFLVAGKEFERKSVAVGVLGNEASKMHPDSKVTIGELAAIQEFGTMDGHIPARPFLKNTMMKRGLVVSALGNAARSVFSGKATVNEALNQAGEILANAVRETILGGVPPANKPATVAWKGHGDTLIGLTDALYDAISHAITGGR